MDLMRDDYIYTYIASASTTQIFTGPCRLIRVCVNTPADGSVNIIDNTTGSTTNVALIKTAAASLNVSPQYYGVKITTGLRVITTGANDITVIWTKS